jgi:hypothetical protein
MKTDLGIGVVVFIVDSMLLVRLPPIVNSPRAVEVSGLEADSLFFAYGDNLSYVEYDELVYNLTPILKVGI